MFESPNEEGDDFADEWSTELADASATNDLEIDEFGDTLELATMLRMSCNGLRAVRGEPVGDPDSFDDDPRTLDEPDDFDLTSVF